MPRDHSSKKYLVKKITKQTGLLELGSNVGDRMRLLHPQGQAIQVNYLQLAREFGKRIVVVGDVHADPRSIDKTKIEELGILLAEIPDVWCYALVGDYVNDDHAEMIHELAEVLIQLKSPVFAVLGNHDYRADENKIIQGLEKAGVNVLRNEHVLLDGISIVGVDCWTTGNDDTQKALEGVKDPYIVLGHEPCLATQHEGFLHVAGHTHHGQIKPAFLKQGIFLPRGSFPYPAGLYEVDNKRYVYTTAGIGYSVVSARFMVQPEIAVLDI